jgi:hypothetical protein
MYYAIVQESYILYIQGYTVYMQPKNGLARVVAIDGSIAGGTYRDLADQKFHRHYGSYNIMGL